MKAKYVHMSLELWVDCPYENCNGFFDLFKIERLTDEGLLYDLVCPKDSFWGCEDFQKKLDEYEIEITCPECGKKIEVESVEW